jgi:hypothetical protein
MLNGDTRVLYLCDQEDIQMILTSISGYGNNPAYTIVIFFYNLHATG